MLTSYSYTLAFVLPFLAWSRYLVEELFPPKVGMGHSLMLSSESRILSSILGSISAPVLSRLSFWSRRVSIMSLSDLSNFLENESASDWLKSARLILLILSRFVSIWTSSSGGCHGGMFVGVLMFNFVTGTLMRPPRSWLAFWIVKLLSCSCSSSLIKLPSPEASIEPIMALNRLEICIRMFSGVPSDKFSSVS